MSKYERVISLFGEESFNKFKDYKIILFGVGGVGSYCLDCLYKSGITDITIVDFDTYDESNQNRQIGSQRVGEVKVEVLKEIYPNIEIIQQKVDPKWVEEFNFDKYDLVLDAIDDIKAKIALIQKTHKKLIVSAGSAKKSDPTKIEITTIHKTYNDPLAKKLREELKKIKFSKRVTTIFSTQETITKTKGSFVGVTASFGLVMCSHSIKVLNKIHK